MCLTLRGGHTNGLLITIKFSKLDINRNSTGNDAI